MSHLKVFTVFLLDGSVTIFCCINRQEMAGTERPRKRPLTEANDHLEGWLGEKSAFSSNEEICKDETYVDLPVVQRSQVSKSSNISNLKTFHLTEDLDMIITFKEYSETGLSKSSKLMNPHLFDRTKSQAHEDKTNHTSENIKETKLSVQEIPSFEELVPTNDFLEWWFEQMSAASSNDNICKEKTTSCTGRLCVKEGFGNQINLFRDRGLNPRPSAQKSDTLPLDHQVTYSSSLSREY
uniref:Uncharacterized protein n=1 Tax=Timema bartmani TaxID=61472 RepID=A0A7R9F2A0_9NEOP|nr:unnamed protein product [Timema bartmani]